MGTYVQTSDCTDPGFRVEESHCSWADTQVRSALLSKAITAAELEGIPLPNAELSMLGSLYACAKAALDAAIEGGNGVLMEKHKSYKAMAADMARQISRQSLGIPSPEAGQPPEFGTFELERG